MFKNTVDLIGFLGKNAEVKVASDSSTNFTVLGLATKESWKNRESGEWESRTEWHNIMPSANWASSPQRLPKALTSKSRVRFGVGSAQLIRTMVALTIRTSSVKAESIRKLDRAETSTSGEGADSDCS